MISPSLIIRRLRVGITRCYKPGFEEYAAAKREFKIEGKKSEQKNNPGFDYSTESGRKESVYLEQNNGKIYLNGMTQSVSGLIFDSQFSIDLD